MLKIILTFSFLVHFSHQQTVDVALLENDLQTATNLMISKEKKVSSTILSCKASAAISSKNLKAVNFNKSLTDALDVMANLTIELLTIKEFEGFTKCQNLTTCECITFRIVLLDTQIKKIDEISENINGNCSKFYESFSSLTWNFALNFKPIQFIWTREVSVLKTCNQSRLLLSEFSDFNRIVNSVKNFYVNVKSFMSSQTSNCSSGNSNFTEEGKQIDEKLRECQNQLLNLTTIALEKVNNSLSSVAAKKVKSSLLDSKSALKSLQNRLRKQETVDDYDMPSLTWPHIPDTSGASGRSFMKVRTSQAKKESYSFTRNAAARNKTKVKKNLDAFKASANTSSGISKRSITLKSTAQELDVITATTNVVNYFDVYIQELNNAIIKVDNMTRIYEQEMLASTTSLSTTSTMSTTTIKPTNVAICHTILDVYDRFGIYQKTFCQIAAGDKTYTNVASHCRENGASHYGVTSYSELAGLFYSMFVNFGSNTLVSFIGGNRVNGSWVFKGKPILPEAVPAAGNITGTCLQLGMSNKNFWFLGANCSLTGLSMCEFVKPTPPLQVYKPSGFCRNTTTINGPNSIKTACIIQLNGGLALNAGACYSNGMRLFSITSAVDFNGLVNFTNQVFGASAQNSFLVRGERLANGSWFVSDSGPTLLYPAIAPSGNGPCLTFVMNSPVTVSQNCDTFPYALCEYTKPLLPPTAKTPPVGCLHFIDLFHPNGSYYKTACRTPSGHNFTTINTWCRNQNLYPFAINSADDVNYAIMFGRSLYGLASNPTVFVDGVQDANGTWFTYAPNQKPLYTGIPINGVGVSLRFTYSKTGIASFQATGSSVTSDGFCEFHRMSP